MPKRTMNLVIRSALLIFCLITMLSCTTTKPYEIKSPCVSIDAENPWFRSPCQRIPINNKWDIA